MHVLKIEVFLELSNEERLLCHQDLLKLGYLTIYDRGFPRLPSLRIYIVSMHPNQLHSPPSVLPLASTRLEQRPQWGPAPSFHTNGWLGIMLTPVRLELAVAFYIRYCS